MTRRWKVLLCGYYGMGNLGDELLARASLHLLEHCGVPLDDAAMLSGNAAESRRLHGVEAFDRWSAREVLSALKQSETLLLGGGGIFQDSTSLRSPLYYWMIVRAARCAGCRVWAFGQSVGPFRSPVSRFLAKNAFHSCRAVGVRDENSRRFFKGRVMLSDDLVLSLPCAKSSAGSKFLVNLRGWDGRLERESAAAFSGLRLPEKATVVGVAMDRADARVMEQLAAEGVLRLDDVVCLTFDKIGGVFDGAFGAFGMRLHFGVLCLKHSVPCTLIPYDPKVSAFALRWGASLWQGGALSMPGAWQDEAEQKRRLNDLEEKFHECFEKVMNR